MINVIFTIVTLYIGRVQHEVQEHWTETNYTGDCHIKSVWYCLCLLELHTGEPQPRKTEQKRNTKLIKCFDCRPVPITHIIYTLN